MPGIASRRMRVQKGPEAGIGRCSRDYPSIARRLPHPLSQRFVELLCDKFCVL